MRGRSPLRRSRLFVVTSLVAFGCGGETSGGTETSGGGSSAAPATGGTTSGGSSSGGAGASAGSSDGGSGALGAGATGAGAAAAAGSSSLPDPCRLEPESGPCEAAIPSYYHDDSTGVCMPFYHGGCDGNENRFENVSDCQARCSGGSPDLDTCERPPDCTVTPASCCGDCEPALFENVVAINVQETDRYRTLRDCEGVACEPCMAVPVWARIAPYFVATCDRGHCVPLDLRRNPVTACTADGDCFLRAGGDCCEACDADEIIAISDGNALSELVCGDAPVPCPRCAAILPPNLVAVCDRGTCAVREVGP